MNDRTEIRVMDRNYSTYAIVDSFISFLWVDRYSSAGEFEIVFPASENLLAIFSIGAYLGIRESDQIMMVETVELISDIENGDTLTVAGRSLSALLSRRIIWGFKVLSGNIDAAIRTILNDSIISPTDLKRKIDGFEFGGFYDSAIVKQIEAQYYGDNVYDVVTDLCKENNIGYKIVPGKSNPYTFYLYSGIDRSYAQNKNPWVIFSSKFENLLSSNYRKSILEFKNATLVSGSGQDDSKIAVDVLSDASTGLDRYEVYTNASDLSNDTSIVDQIPDLTDEVKEEIIKLLTEKFKDQLSQKGSEELAKCQKLDEYDGEIDASIQYVYGEDFFLGDIVQIRTVYGNNKAVRITEVAISHDSSGKTIVPTFESLDE